MKTTTPSLPSKYIWSLDNDRPLDAIKGYREALGNKPHSALSNIVSLLEARVPITPKAYLTSAVQEFAGKPSNALIEELDQSMARFEHSLFT